MVRLRDIPRTATFAWSPGAGKPMVVTGTKAGAVDADFSDESKLELWDLALDNQEQGIELQPVVSITTESSRFYDIAWGPPDANHPRGIVAGALENGTLELWDVEKLEAGASDASISKTTKHTGAIKALQFNPLKPQILATAGAKGELFIYDIGDIENPFRLGNAAARSDDIDCLAWNRKVSHILATGGPGGFVTVWDLKTKKASLTLNNNRKAVSAIAWDPNNSTKLLTATPDDNTPVIFLWDLRNSNAPEKTLQGHEQGVLSLSWCQQDPDLLLSSGKDNKTIVWNPHTGERYGELPEVTNWTFQTRFHPHNPNLSATASFDGKITIQTLQNTNPDKSQAINEKPLDDEEFFRAAQTQPQGASWSLPKAPKWFERPIGASFGFGGKLVIFKELPTQAGQKRQSKLSISQFSADSDVASAIERFQEALKSEDVVTLCEERKAQAQTDEEKADWTVIETLIGENPRSKIVEHLGFKEEDLTNGSAAGTPEGEEKETPKKEEEATDAEGKPRRLSNFFGGDGEGEGDDFLSGLAANKGAKTDKPFHLFSDGDTSVEKDITRALMLGNFAKATDICLKEDRIADAFLIANCGGQELVEKVQSAYLARKDGVPSYLRLISSVVDKNLWDIVYNADLENWKETMAIICTFSDPTEFPDLCEALGDRINEQGQRKDASFCYLVGSKLEKVVAIWVDELKEAEQARMQQESGDSTFSVHTRSLQSFIEKVTVFRHVAKFQDKELSKTADWKLATLYDKYTEYAEILAGQGKLEVAQKFLDLLPANYPAAELTRSRVKLATQKKPAAVPITVSRRTPSTTSAGKQPPVVGYQPPQPASIPAPTNPYVGLQQTSPAVSASQQYKPPVNPYQPQGYQPQGYQPQGYQPPSQFGYTGAPIAPPPISGPPRNTTPSSSGPPPAAKAKNTENWNDVPMVTKAAPRRSTPSVPPIASPFGAQQGQAAHPPPPSSTSPYGAGARASPPPPPKGPAPPRVQSPLAGPPVTGPPRTSSAAANPYAPPTPITGAIPTHPAPPVMPRTASPYNAPPAGPPPSNRYAPVTGTQQQQPGQYGSATMPPPPGPASRPPPPANPYAPPVQQQPAAPSPYAPSPYAPAPGQVPATQPPPTGPPPMGRPPSTTSAPPPAKQTAPPPAAKHPPGDRSHIPPHAQQLVDILSSDMQRVASKAPPTFAPQVKDTQKRLNILFDHLNNEELVQASTIEQLTQLAIAMQAKDYATAQRLQMEINRDKTEECGNWMVGVKRLISMSKATP
ncbi:transport protein [Trichoderma reesei RUT C-30]|uniref:Protein transport protein SEC31 n=1 Tax=Hypocrea jecorina (strain ATCC 56765 / BCRC 32924 / NRRL 11460 / Rut C-30) TaxID=1344414 RepID=A0A024SKQ0_HYPJR|nr:transport protein [Trichoderma reesei RUT C-30]